MSTGDDGYVHADPPDLALHPRAADVDTPVARKVFAVGMALAVAFVAWGVIAPENLAATATAILGGTIDATGWIYVLVTAGFVALMLLSLERNDTF